MFNIIWPGPVGLLASPYPGPLMQAFVLVYLMYTSRATEFTAHHTTTFCFPSPRFHFLTGHIVWYIFVHFTYDVFP